MTRPPEEDRAGSLLERFGGNIAEKLGSVAVKDVRQLLRGRFIPLAIAAITLGSLVVATIALSGFEASEMPSGQRILGSSVPFLLLATFFLLPLVAFASLAAERDEDTFDLLLLSGLDARGIVRGKWLASMVVALLFAFAFAPFLVVSLLLPGVDAGTVIWSLALALAGGGALTMIALMLATVRAGRVGRALLVVVFLLVATIALFAAFGSIFVSAGTGVHRSSRELFTALGQVAVAAFVTWFHAFAFATIRLSHPEEDRSAPLRRAALVTVIAIFVPLWLVAEYRRAVDGSYHVDSDDLGTVTIVGIVMAAIVGVFLVTEPDRLPRRAAYDLAAAAPRRFPRIGDVLLRSGGGRGFLFLIGIFLLYLGICALLQERLSGGHHDGLHGAVHLAQWVLAYLGISRTLASSRCETASQRKRTRGTIFAGALLLAILPHVLTLLGGGIWDDPRESVFNVAYVVSDGLDDPLPGIQEFVLGLAAAMGVMLNASRMRSAIAEVRLAAQRKPDQALYEEPVEPMGETP
jgi:hypothetical protein